ncbi:MAG TPA: PIN domain-containing protein [Clostridia bacterium]|nr:PIN domain-containing protein [Clostridia bacterium]
MSKMLIDSSVWIEYFKSENKHKVIDELIEENVICTNKLILTELLPYLYIKKENELIDSLNTIEKIEIKINWDTITKMQIKNIKNGINKVGIPDLIILQNVIENDLILYSIDKHFLLMKKVFDFNLYEN